MSETPEILLHSLAGKPAPPELGPALRAIRELAPALTAKFHEVLGATLEMLPEDQVDNRIVRLCRKLDVDPEKAAPAIKSARWLLRNAASNDVSPDELTQDLRALAGADTPVCDLVVPVYEKALPSIRLEIVQGALRAHGNVLTGLEWRIDTIGASNLGANLKFPVALLTLHYQDRQQPGSFTVQLTSDMVAQLRDLCDQLLQS